MKGRRVAVCVVAALAMESVMMMAAGAQEPVTEAVQETAGLSDQWSDYQVQIDDTVYQFPMLYDDFTALGWTTDETEELELEPNQYTMTIFERDGIKSTIFLLNLGLNTVEAQQCIVAGMEIDPYYWDLDQGTIVLPGGIVRGAARVDDITAAYGTPSDTYEGDLYTKLTYETDYNSSVEMEVYKESGVLENIEIRNFVEPEGYDVGEASDEVPESVSSYEKEEALSDDLETYQIELDGQVYSVPVPVSVLAEDGWTLDEDDSDSVIKAGSYGWVTLRKGGQEIHEIAVNPERYATGPLNCWIEELEIGGYSLDAQGALPGGITEGMTEEEFLKILEEAGMEYEAEESGNYRYYTYNEKRYDQCMEVTVYTGEDDIYEQNTIITISCSNPVE